MKFNTILIAFLRQLVQQFIFGWDLVWSTSKKKFLKHKIIFRRNCFQTEFSNFVKLVRCLPCYPQANNSIFKTMLKLFVCSHILMIFLVVLSVLHRLIIKSSKVNRFITHTQSFNHKSIIVICGFSTATPFINLI